MSSKLAPMILSSRLNDPDLGSIRVVSWDVDGTLYSTRRMKWHLLMLASASTIRGLRLSPVRELNELQDFRKRMESARSASGNLTFLNHDLARRLQIEERWLAPSIARAGPRPGVRDLLRYFRTRVRTQVILSDYEAEYKLKCLGLEGHFEAIYIGEHLGFIKPSPAPFIKILEDLGVSAECLLHIGNRAETDGEGAKAAGCPSLVLGRDFRSFKQLLRTLTQNS